jgi:tetratricopeptide (TPR) repeat protein
LPAPRDRFASIDALIAALTRAIDAPRRRAIAAGGAGAVVIAAIAALALGSRDAATPCRGAADRVDEVWSDETAAAVDTAFAATRRPHAARTAQLVDAALDAYVHDWAAMSTSSCQATHRGDQSADLLDLRAHCLDRRLDTLTALVAVLRDAPDGEVVDHAVEAVLSLPELGACADVTALRDELALPADPALRTRLAAIDAQLDQVVALTTTAQYGEARAIAEAALTEARDAGHPPQLAHALYLLGSLQEQLGEGDAASASMKEAARVGAGAHDDSLTARALIDLIWITGSFQSRYDEAMAMTASVEAAVARAGEPATLRSRLDARVGSLLGAQGRYDEAVTLLERALAVREAALGPDHAELTSVLNALGEVLRAAGRYQDARRYYERALAISERVLGPDHPDVGALLNNLGLTLWSEGKYDEAHRLIERSLALDEATFGPDHPRVATSLISLGGLFQEQGRAAEARPLLERALAIQRRSLGPDHPELAMALHNLGAVTQLEGDHLGAIAYFEEALAIFERALPTDHPHLAHPLSGIGESLLSLGRADEALAPLRRAITLQDRAFGEDHVDTAYALTSLGTALLSLHRVAEAVSPLERAVTLRTAHPVAPGELASSQFLLAQVLWSGGGDRRRARALAEAARDGNADPDAGDAAALAVVERWLATHPRPR